MNGVVLLLQLLIVCCALVQQPLVANTVPKHALKLYYFGFRGRGEYIRMTLKYAGVPFVDFNVEREQWPSLKAQMPLGQIPVLEVDGVKIGQSKAIGRFIGEEYGLTAKTNIERARLDMAADVVCEGVDETGDWARVALGIKSVPDKKAFYREQIRPSVEKHAALIEKLLVEGGSPLLGGDQITWVDIYAAEFFSKCVEFGDADVLDAFPSVRALVARVQSAPRIKEYIAQRKPTPY